MTWTIEEARKFLRKAQPIAKQAGYLLALYGSTVEDGRGRDLDIIAVPWARECKVENLVAELSWMPKMEREDMRNYIGDRNTMSVILIYDGKPIDLHVREVDQVYAMSKDDVFGGHFRPSL